MRALLLLDFDGVLNALLDRREAPNSDWSDWDRNVVDGFVTWTSKSMAAAVTALADIQWLTTWNEDDKANKLLSPLLKISTFPVAAAPADYPERDNLWKPRAVASAIKTGRHVVWLDDDCELLWAEWLEAAPEWKHEDISRLFKLAPEHTVGLTAEHVSAVADWLKSHEAS